MRRFVALLALIGAVVFAAPAVACASSDQFAEVRARVAEAQVLIDDAVAAAETGGRERASAPARPAHPPPEPPGARRGAGGPRSCLRPRAPRLPRPLRAGGGAAALARPEPRARPRVQL